MKDLSANGWLGLVDLEQIQMKVEADFGGVLTGVNENSAVDDSSKGVSDGDGERCGSLSDSPRSERPVSEEYENLLLRAKNIFDEIRNVPIEQQMRRKLKKKVLSGKMLNYADWLAYDVMLCLEAGEMDDLSIVNTVIYTVAAVIS